MISNSPSSAVDVITKSLRVTAPFLASYVPSKIVFLLVSLFTSSAFLVVLFVREALAA
jgi:hypothetical protein